MAKESSLKKAWLKKGLPSIAKMITEYFHEQNKTAGKD